jgi:two-component system cell cycle response regulator
VRFARHPRARRATRCCWLLRAARAILEAIDAGADDVLVKPLDIQTLRVRLNTATRMLLLREEIQRERRGIMRSTDEFAVAHKRLLQEALTDP